MPLENSLNVSPYFDDYDQAKEFYRILFKPGVAVQTRELNQLQSIMQNQIERFGNHVFKSGTIVSGVNFSYMPNYSFVKITDTQVDGQPSLPSSYLGYFVKSNLNLTARVVNYEDGLESKSPDLKTLYLQYVNSSDADVSNSNVKYTSFTPGQQLTVFSQYNELFQVNVNNGGQGFSNADTVVVTSSITVSGNTIAFSNGETLTQSTTGAKVVIASINTTAIANTIILRVKPRTADLTNNSVNAVSWSLYTGYNVVGGSSGATANVVSLIGSGATGLITTDTQGIVQTITLSSGGTNYSYLPHVTIKTSNTTATVNNLDLGPQNYKTIVTVGNSSVNSVGTGYGFSVSEGIIYQKGFFLKVDPQVIIVDKYSISPNNVAVGFKTVETIVDSNVDETLFDNATGTTNYTAPGANRLKLTPTLMKTTLNDAAANVDFFALAEWKEGYPYKENRITAYANLSEEFARRTREAQGDFVVDKFQILTREKTTANTTHFEMVIDPGTAYIAGRRVATEYNNYIDVPRATATETLANRNITANYGNYIKVKELAGLFKFKAGATISLRDTAKTYIGASTVGSSTSISAPGNQIGTARIRSLVVDSGDPGTAECVYRLYIFDVVMSLGYSFRDVRSVYYDDTEDGVADVVLQQDTTSSSNVAVIIDPTFDTMVFSTGLKAVKAIDNINFSYRTSSDTTLQLASTGQLQIGPLGSGLTFPYGDGALSATQRKDFIIFPVANTQASANIAGTLTVTSGSNTITGSGTSFTTALVVGDFIKVANGTANSVLQVTAIANNTQLSVRTTAPATYTGGANGVIFYPAMYPLSLESRSDRSVTISGGSKTATLNINKTLTATVNAIAVYNVKKVSASPVTKSVNRDVFVKLHTSNNVTSNYGPWALGVPGALRLKNVYLGDASTVNTNSTDVTKHFFIDAGDDENAYRSASLVLQKNSGLTITTNQYIMVKFDALTTGGQEGFFTVDSYPINDTLSLAASTATVNTLELPETMTVRGAYFDSRDVFDFRPYGSNTAVLSTTAAGASINPANTFALSGDDQFFPVPDSEIQYDIEYYLPRVDRVAVDKNSDFKIVQGVPSTNPAPPSAISGTINLGIVKIPQYPSLPAVFNATTLDFAAKQIGNSRGVVDSRVKRFNITNMPTVGRAAQPRRYTMSQIGSLDRRISSLEYAVSLNVLERSIKNKDIPSAITPSTSRFKNGFFVEGFDNYAYASPADSEFSATIDQTNSMLKPKTKQFNLELQFDRTDATTLACIVNDTFIGLPYTEEVLIDQSVKSAQAGPITKTVANTVANTATNTVINTKLQYNGEMSIWPASFSISSRVEPAVTSSLVTGASFASVDNSTAGLDISAVAVTLGVGFVSLPPKSGESDVDTLTVDPTIDPDGGGDDDGGGDNGGVSDDFTSIDSPLGDDPVDLDMYGLDPNYGGLDTTDFGGDAGVGGVVLYGDVSISSGGGGGGGGKVDYWNRANMAE